MKDIEDYTKKSCKNYFPALQKMLVFIWHSICSKHNAIQYVWSYEFKDFPPPPPWPLLVVIFLFLGLKHTKNIYNSLFS